jgi:hypothetical protein
MRLELLCLLMSAVPKAMAFAPSSLRPSHLRPTMAPPQRRASAPLLLDRRHALGAALGVALSTMLSSPSSAAPPESAKGGSVSLGGAANTLAAPAPASGPWPYSTLIEEIDRQRVASARISDDGKQVLATDVDGGIHDSTIFSASDLIGRLTKAHTKFEISPPDADPARPLAEAFLGLLPPVILLGGLFFLARGMPGSPLGSGSNNPLNFGKSQKEVDLVPDTGVTFDDVAGCDGSKLELSEVVDFLKDPSKWSAATRRPLVVLTAELADIFITCKFSTVWRRRRRARPTGTPSSAPRSRVAR